MSQFRNELRLYRQREACRFTDMETGSTESLLRGLLEILENPGRAQCASTEKVHIVTTGHRAWLMSFLLSRELEGHAGRWHLAENGHVRAGIESSAAQIWETLADVDSEGVGRVRRTLHHPEIWTKMEGPHITEETQ